MTIEIFVILVILFCDFSQSGIKEGLLTMVTTTTNTLLQGRRMGLGYHNPGGEAGSKKFMGVLSTFIYKQLDNCVRLCMIQL